MQNIDRGVWPDQDGTPVITQSMVSNFAECPREVYYSSVLGLRTRITSKPLTRGTWIHALLEERANGRDWRVKHEQLIEEAKASSFDEEAQDLADECRNILLSYEYVYRDEKLTPIHAELTVERPIFGGKALYRGRIDLIVRDGAGDVWLLDHKTHARFPEWRYRELAFQNYSYLWAVKKSPSYKALGLPQPKGFIYDYCKTGVIKTPTFTTTGKISRSLKPTGTTLPVFENWLREHNMLTSINGNDLLAIEDDSEREYVEWFLEELRNKDYSDLFRRDAMQFSEAQEKRQLKSFLTTVKRMLQYKWDDPDCVERNLHACSGFMCNYKDLTVADLMHGDSQIEQATRYVKTRNPLDYYPNQDKEGKPKKRKGKKKK